MSNAIKQSGAYLEIVSFHLSDQEFCIDIMAIREIRGWAPVTPMPHTPPYVLGLINLRGAVIPVIDMAGRLGMKMTEPSNAPPSSSPISAASWSDFWWNRSPT